MTIEVRSKGRVPSVKISVSIVQPSIFVEFMPAKVTSLLKLKGQNCNFKFKCQVCFVKNVKN